MIIPHCPHVSTGLMPRRRASLEIGYSKEHHWLRRPFLHKVDLGSEEVKTWLCQWRNPGVD